MKTLRRPHAPAGLTTDLTTDLMIGLMTDLTIGLTTALTRALTTVLIGTLLCLGATSSLAQAQAQPTPQVSASAPRIARDGTPKVAVRSATLPARGLFEGDKLSPGAMQKLDALLAGASDLDVEAAFVVPSGPWLAEGGGAGERSLTPARLQALRDFLARRGVDARRVFVESRIDPKAADARLIVELLGRPAPQ
jgi:OmpA-OmpF porin, OOP family